VTMNIREGKAEIAVFDGVFYNPLAKFTRSFGIIVLSAFSKYTGRGLTVSDAFSGTGIRGIRYYLESINIEKIIFNDRSSRAYENIKYNVLLNRIDSYEIYKLDANIFLNLVGREYADVIDIDPYGSPSKYIDSAMYAIKNRGIIAITATDLTALCGLFPRSAFRKYNSRIIKNDFCHEVALRVLIKELVISGGRHGKIVHPLVSMFSEQYARIYVYVYRGKIGYPYKNIGYITLGEDGYIVTTSLSKIKSEKYIGPLWIGSMHDPVFLNKMEDILEFYISYDKDFKKIYKIIKDMKNECFLPPFYYKISRLSSILKISPPSIKEVLHELKSRGFKAGVSHINRDYLKTDAPYSLVLDVLRTLGSKKKHI